MLKRTLVFSQPWHLSLHLDQIVISCSESDEKTTIPIEDVSIILIEHQQTSITVPLINKLAENNVSLIFCDRKGMPASLLNGFGSNVYQGEILRGQMDSGEVLKKKLWKNIVTCKIRNQYQLLKKLEKNAVSLKPYYQNVKSGDSDNREGIASRIYFKELFGRDFIRERTENGINALLNYGYTILRSAVSRAIVCSGLFPGIGINHHNRSNVFPLADDLMEPYRPYVDEIVFDLYCNGMCDLDKETKRDLINVLYADTHFQEVSRPLSVGLSLTTASLVKCYAGEQTVLSFPILE